MLSRISEKVFLTIASYLRFSVNGRSNPLAQSADHQALLPDRWNGAGVVVRALGSIPGNPIV